MELLRDNSKFYVRNRIFVLHFWGFGHVMLGEKVPFRFTLLVNRVLQTQNFRLYYAPSGCTEKFSATFTPSHCQCGFLSKCVWCKSACFDMMIIPGCSCTKAGLPECAALYVGICILVEILFLQ